MDKLTITNEHWDIVVEKYHNLFHYISNKISGDKVLFSHEDNISELYIAVMKAIKGYYKLTGLSVDYILKDLDFDKYIKSCIWNKKNSIGDKIKRGYEVNNKMVSIDDNPEVFEISAKNVSIQPDETQQILSNKFSKIHLDILHLVQNEKDILKKNGRINALKVANILGISYFVIRKHIKDISKFCENIF